MCGRFTHHLPWSEIHRLYRLTLDKDRGRNTQPRYNIAPTQSVLFVHHDKEGNQVVDEGRWWLVPHWAKEMPKATLFNARSETAPTTPAFRDAFKARRCLIPADGFYEWTVSREDGKKDPWYIFQPGGAPFSFAGLWAHNDKLGVTSCTILTAGAEEPMRQLHDRQPVILDPAFYDEWLSAETPVPQATELLKHHLDGQLQFHRVCRDVNSSKFQDAMAINPL
ncbi:SOS response-associated peptidase [Neorhizobium sp. T6_25]|uniref:SOS response-associated peptidase n=1 Tax=Neorhizobium sp. T6_25 TaxID=2093833 RepID=UPI000CF9338C|nr:SOS response-associated peptidase [Neorhizobium sp. T6_25]